MVGKGKWKPLELSLTRKIKSQIKYHIPGRIAEIIVTIKDPWVVIATTSPFNSPI